MPIPPPTARLEFRRWERSDLALAAGLWGDPRVMQFLGGPYTHEEVVERIEREIANEEAHGIQYWPVFIKDSGVFAGCCGLKPLRPDERQLEIGFHFRPELWGVGYASEAARAVMAHAFEELNAAALFAGRHPENDASAALLAKLGFEQIGTHFFARTGLQHPWYELERAGGGNYGS